jgi:site-specific recombinase XerD
MIETLFPRRDVAERLRQGLFGPYMDELGAYLTQQRFSTDTIRRSLSAAGRFCDWLSAQGLSLGDAQQATVARYLSELGRTRSGGRMHVAQGLHHSVRFLHQKGLVASTLASALELTPAEKWLRSFEQYSTQVAGAAASTCQRYRPILRRFLAERFGAGTLDWASLSADDLAKFARQEVSARKNFGRKVPSTALRAMLHYLVFCGAVRRGLEGAIPTIRQWKHAALPLQLTEQQIAAVLASSQETPAGLRDHAVLLLLARVGMRAKEVARLSIDEVDWLGGRLVLRAGKTHRERILPLSEEVGQALATYLTRGRPESKSRVIFLRSLAPFEPLEGASAVSRIARRHLLRTGYPEGAGLGAHLFRHTVASLMVCHGATFKDVADVLGHQSLETTGIYAKLDLTALAQVALPWNGGTQ